MRTNYPAWANTEADILAEVEAEALAIGEAQVIGVLRFSGLREHFAHDLGYTEELVKLTMHQLNRVVLACPEPCPLSATRKYVVEFLVRKRFRYRNLFSGWVGPILTYRND